MVRALDGAAAEASARVVATCRRVPVGGVFAVASLLAAGGIGTWAVLFVAARLSATG